jgi:hypothetical protein
MSRVNKPLTNKNTLLYGGSERIPGLRFKWFFTAPGADSHCLKKLGYFEYFYLFANSWIVTTFI